MFQFVFQFLACRNLVFQKMFLSHNPGCRFFWRNPWIAKVSIQGIFSIPFRRKCSNCKTPTFQRFVLCAYTLSSCVFNVPQLGCLPTKPNNFKPTNPRVEVSRSWRFFHQPTNPPTTPQNTSIFRNKEAPSVCALSFSAPWSVGFFHKNPIYNLSKEVWMRNFRVTNF